MYMSKDDTGGNGDDELWVLYGNGSVNDSPGCMHDNHVHMELEKLEGVSDGINANNAQPNFIPSCENLL